MPWRSNLVSFGVCKMLTIHDFESAVGNGTTVYRKSNETLRRLSNYNKSKHKSNEPILMSRREQLQKRGNLFMRLYSLLGVMGTRKSSLF